MTPARDPDQADASLKERTGQFTETLRNQCKKLSTLASRLHRSKPDAKTYSLLLSSLAEPLTHIAELAATANSLAADWDRLLSVDFLQLESKLRDICEGHGWRLDGQWPDFTVEYGIPLQIDEKRRTIRIADAKNTPLVELADALADAVASLIPKGFSGLAFLQQLASAYDAIATESGRQVPIFDVYRELVIRSQPQKLWRDAAAQGFVPLTIHQFRARLSRTLQDAAPTLQDGRQLRLFPPLDTKDAIFLYQPSERRFGYVGRIEFSTL